MGAWLDWSFDKTMSIAGLILTIWAVVEVKRAKRAVEEHRIATAPVEGLALAQIARIHLARRRTADTPELKRCYNETLRESLLRLVMQCRLIGVTGMHISTIEERTQFLSEQPSVLRLQKRWMASLDDAMIQLEFDFQSKIRGSL